MRISRQDAYIICGLILLEFTLSFYHKYGDFYKNYTFLGEK